MDNPQTQTAGYGDQPCLVTLTYGPDFTGKTWPTNFPKPTNLRDNTELRYRLASSAEFLVLPEGATEFSDSEDDLRRDENSLMLIGYKDIELQWDFVDDPPIKRLDSLKGCVNSFVGDPFLGAESETLLFETYDIEDSFKLSPTSPHTNRVNIHLRQRRIEFLGSIKGWNDEYQATEQQFKRVFLKTKDAGGEEGLRPRYLFKPFGDMFADGDAEIPF